MSYVHGAAHAFQKFAVNAETAHHIAELAGLGLLTIPALNHFLGDPEHDSPTRQRVMAGTELAGLGVLAAPSIHSLMKA
jgi:hypothetical protein